MVPLCDLRLQYAKLKPEIDAAIQSVCENAPDVPGLPYRGFGNHFAERIDRLSDQFAACIALADALCLVVTAVIRGRIASVDGPSVPADNLPIILVHS